MGWNLTPNCHKERPNVNSNRYIITRSCLEDGTMRLLKYNESLFPQAGQMTLRDEQGREFMVDVDRQKMLVTGLHSLYHDHNLGVNDVMLLHPQGEGRYRVEFIVKPHAVTPAKAPAPKLAPKPGRVVIASTPHVREVRLALTPGADGPTAAVQPAQPQPVDAKPAAKKLIPQTSVPAAPKAPKLPAQASAEDQVAEFARLTGYRVEYPATGLVRLHAELGPQYGYSVLLAADPLAMSQPAWENALDEAKLLMTREAERPEGLARFTREALASLTEHAQLAPLSPLDLRSYWRSGDIDLASVAALTELLSAHLAQRGTFTAVLLELAQQPAHSVVKVSELGRLLGSGANPAEIQSALETLSRPPFMALTPLTSKEYLLRTDVASLLGELSEYAAGVRRRLGTAQAQAPKAAAEVLV